MHINGILFLNIISWNILFATGSIINKPKTKNIEDVINQVKKIYLQRGFKIICIHDDSEFGQLREEISDLGIYLNFMFKKEHLTNIERFNQTPRERVWSSREAMPFRKISE